MFMCIKIQDLKPRLLCFASDLINLLIHRVCQSSLSMLEDEGMMVKQRFGDERKTEIRGMGKCEV